MKKTLIYSGVIAVIAAGLVSCANDYEKYDNSYLLDNPETMTLQASSSVLELFEETPADEAVLTFTWTPAREMSDEYDLKYITYLDLKVNGFDENSALRTVENPGVFEKSYTTEQLQNYITENWGQSVSEETTLSFKVVATWEGGTRYIMPEVRTVDVDVQPYKPLVFDADVVYVSGSAKTGLAKETVARTLENEYRYAKVVTLQQGELTIPTEYDGVVQYIAPEVPADFVDGEPVPAKMLPENPDETAPEEAGWTIPGSGDYRVVVDMEKKTVTIYSPDNEFNNPFTVEWYPNCNLSYKPYTTTVTQLWIRGDGAIKPDGGTWYELGNPLNVKQSEADPQILVYDGAALKSGRNSFAIISQLEYDANGDGTKETFNCNNSYVFAPTRVDSDGNGYHDGQGVDINGNGIPSDKGDEEDGVYTTDANHDESVTLGVWMDMDGGPDIRGNYFKTPSGLNFIVFDLRNMKVKFEVR